MSTLTTHLTKRTVLEKYFLSWVSPLCLPCKGSTANLQMQKAQLERSNATPDSRDVEHIPQRAPRRKELLAFLFLVFCAKDVNTNQQFQLCVFSGPPFTTRFIQRRLLKSLLSLHFQGVMSSLGSVLIPVQTASRAKSIWSCCLFHHLTRPFKE